MTIADNIARLRAALAAGPSAMLMAEGPAAPSPESPEGGDYCVMDGGTNIVAEFFFRVNHGPGGTRPAKANAMLYAAADPATIAALLAAWDEREAMRKDAERYRWLRNSDWEHFDSEWLQEHGCTNLVGGAEAYNVALDAAIDAAMQERQA